MTSVNQPSITLSLFFDYCTQHSLPFAFYRLPEQKAIHVTAQKKSKVKNTFTSEEAGFLFAPFAEDVALRKVFISADIQQEEKNLPALNFAANHKQTSIGAIPFHSKSTLKPEFEKRVSKIKSAIQQGRFSKVVAARVRKIKKPLAFHPAVFFKKLCQKYPLAFVSLVYTPAYGIWIGATPEVLLQAQGSEFKTYSLAGTQENKVHTNPKWGQKETIEQQIVTEYISRHFKTSGKGLLYITKPETIIAGNLLHLRSTFTLTGVDYKTWPQIVARLHPTPAVAGVPKKEAIHFIQREEPSPRRFYSGYLGPVNHSQETSLFVNLRCMEVTPQHLILYTGCGITKDSVPAKEWAETRIKLQTLLNVLDGMNACR